MSWLINFLCVFGNALGQYLILEQRYWVYGLTPILYTIGTIFGTLFLTKSFGPLGPMMGTLCGAVLYVLYRAYGALRLGFRPSKKFWHPDLHEMGLKMLPRMIALAALQLQLLFFDKIASGMDAGSVTINAYTRNFQGLIVGIAGIALAQSAYSLLSQVAALGEWHRFRTYVEKGLLLLLLLTVPGSIALIALSSVAARLVHLTHVLHPFTIALILYAISVPFESIAHLFLRSFYALKDTLAPAIWAVFSGVAAVIIAWWLAPKYGVFALPFGYGVGQIIETVILGFLLQKRMKAHASLRSLAEGAISE
jgi:putative peptidoglycan lipid II flippase